MYLPRSADLANPFDEPRASSPPEISQLATLEHVLALEYLYAYFSIKTPEEATASLAAWPHLRDDVTFIRHFVLLIAVGEMLHLRWANQLLWELADRRLIPPGKFGPQLGVAETIPVSAAGGSTGRPRALRPLTRGDSGRFRRGRAAQRLHRGPVRTGHSDAAAACVSRRTLPVRLTNRERGDGPLRALPRHRPRRPPVPRSDPSLSPRSHARPTRRPGRQGCDHPLSTHHLRADHSLCHGAG